MTEREQLVADHAEQMLKTITLPKNASKGHWGSLDAHHMLYLLDREIEEFKAAVWGHILHGQPVERVAEEASDASNFLAMITDNLKRSANGMPKVPQQNIQASGD